MHYNDSMRHAVGVFPVDPRDFRRVFSEEVQVGHRLGIVIFESHGIQTHEMHTGNGKGIIFGPENPLEIVLSVPETVVVADHGDIRKSGLFHRVAAPHEFLREPEVRQVAPVYYKVHITAATDNLYRTQCLPCRIVGVGDEGKAQRQCRSRTDKRLDRRAVRIPLAFDLSSVRR